MTMYFFLVAKVHAELASRCFFWVNTGIQDKKEGGTPSSDSARFDQWKLRRAALLLAQQHND
jgi:hypothetical protein